MEDAVTKNGLDVDIAKLSNCPYHSMDECQEKCEKYYRCYTISLANDLLVEYELELSDTRTKNYKLAKGRYVAPFKIYFIY